MSPTHTPVDLVFTGGPVHTLAPARTRASSVAVRGERIVAVGHDEVRELIGPRTEVVDLRGKLLIPGFQDAISIRWAAASSSVSAICPG